MLFSII